MSRRELFGMFRRAPEPEVTPVPEPEPEQVPEPFSLDRFYRNRAPATALPHFTVRTAEAHATTRVGVGPTVAAMPPPSTVRADAGAAPPVAIAAGQVPAVLDSACLATRSFCSVCVERCPRPGAIVVEQGRPRVVPSACDGCGHCIAVCPAPVLAFVLVSRATPSPEPRHA